MPIDSLHPDYVATSDQWQRCRDVTAGSDAVKAARTAYLPQLSGQKDSEYSAYLQRACFYGAMQRTIQGLAGMVFRKDAELNYPQKLMEELEDITLTGMALDTMSASIFRAILEVGRHGVLIDMPRDPSLNARPYWVPYSAESIINWRTGKIGQETQLTMVVLSEKEIHPDPADPFEVKTRQLYRILSLDENGYYQVELFEKGDKETILIDSATPLLRGERINFIPFYFFPCIAVEKPPLLDLADMNLSHYRTSADLEHGRHFTALPILTITGCTAEESKITIGSAKALTFTNADARVTFAEFTGQGLGALEKALEEKEQKMALLGARMLEPEKRAAEAAETLKLRKFGESSMLASLAQECSRIIEDALEFTAEWSGGNPDEVSYKLNTDFEEMTITSADLRELVATWQAGGISWRTFYENLAAGEIARVGVSAEEERKEIDSETTAEKI